MFREDGRNCSFVLRLFSQMNSKCSRSAMSRPESQHSQRCYISSLSTWYHARHLLPAAFSLSRALRPLLHKQTASYTRAHGNCQGIPFVCCEKTARIALRKKPSRASGRGSVYPSIGKKGAWVTGGCLHLRVDTCRYGLTAIRLGTSIEDMCSHWSWKQKREGKTGVNVLRTWRRAIDGYRGFALSQ
jgi:hypothetical protein